MSNPNYTFANTQPGASPFYQQNVTWEGDQPNITQTVDPDQQLALSLQNKGNTMLADMSVEQLGKLRGLLGNPFSFSAPQMTLADSASQAPNRGWDPYGYGSQQRGGEFGHYNDPNALLQMLSGSDWTNALNTPGPPAAPGNIANAPGTWAGDPTTGGTRFTPTNGQYQNSPNVPYGFGPMGQPTTGADLAAGKGPQGWQIDPGKVVIPGTTTPVPSPSGTPPPGAPPPSGTPPPAGTPPPSGTGGPPTAGHGGTVWSPDYGVDLNPIPTSQYQQQGTVNESGVAPMPINAGMTGQQAIMSRLEPQIQRDRTSLETQLTNQGLRPGMEAWNNAMTLLNQQHNDQRTQAAMQGLGLDMSANEQGFGQAMSRGQFGNAATQTNLGNLINKQQAWNSAQGQLFNQIQNTGQFNNQAQAQAFQQALAQRELPLNEISALMSGNQVQQPSFQSYNPVGAAPAPVFQGAQAQGNWDMQQYQQQVAQKNAMMQGLFSLGGGLLGGAGAAGGFGKLFCWIAQAVYGDFDPRVDIVRTYLLGPFSEHFYGRFIVWIYRKTGRQIATLAKRSSTLRSLLRPLFDAVLRAAMVQ